MNHILWTSGLGVKKLIVRKTDTGNVSGVVLDPRHNLGRKVSLKSEKMHLSHPSLLMNCESLKASIKVCQGV